MLENILHVISNNLTKFNQLGASAQKDRNILMDSIHNSSEFLHSNDFRTAHRRFQGGYKKSVLNRKARTDSRNLLAMAYKRDLINVTLMACTNKEKIKAGQGLLAKQPYLELTPSSCSLWVQAGAQLFTQNNLTHTGPVKAPSPLEAIPSILTNPLSSAYNLGREALISADNFISSIMIEILPWHCAEARVENRPNTNSLSEFPLKNPEQSVEEGRHIGVRASVHKVDRDKYEEIISTIKAEYPEIYNYASLFLKLKIKDKYDLDLDPNKVWFNRFNSATSSEVSFTGFEHTGHPQDTKTLTEQLLANFGTEDRLNDDALSGNSGIYTEGSWGTVFGKENEVRLLPVQFSEIVKNSDFSRVYIKNLDLFWRKNFSKFRIMNKGIFISLLAKHVGQLSDQALHLVVSAVLGHKLNLNKITLHDLKKSFIKLNFEIMAFDINGYESSDILLIHYPQSDFFNKSINSIIVLYQPTEERSFIEFDNRQELNQWVVKQAKNPQSRTALANHFSLYDRQDGRQYSGVDTLLKELGDGSRDTKYINYNPRLVYGDPFTWISIRAMERTRSDAKTLTTTNGEVFKQQLIMNLRPAANMAGVASMLLPGPGSLALLGIGVVQIGLGIDQTINGDTQQQRNEGVSDIVEGGINALFGAAGFGEHLNEAELPVQRAELAESDLHKSIKIDTDELHDVKVLDSNKPSTWADYKIEQRGITAIQKSDAVKAALIADSLKDLRIALDRASNRLRLPEGEEIAARYLGLKNRSELTVLDRLAINENITGMKNFLIKSLDNDKTYQTVKYIGTGNSNTIAFYSIGSKKINLTKHFFSPDHLYRLRVLMHEFVHAGVKEAGKPTPDYFYLRASTLKENGINLNRDEMLFISQGKLNMEYFMSKDFHLLRENFAKKMGEKYWFSAAVKFINNQELRKELLLKNPDTQTMMIMELAYKIERVIGNDGKMKLPWGENEELKISR